MDIAGITGGVTDRITLSEYIREVDIGVFDDERGVRQRIEFAVAVDLTPRTATPLDVLSETMSYDLIVEAVEAEVTRARVELLETLAEGIATRLLTHDRAARVWVRIEKLDRIKGRLGVEIVRGGNP